jgi:transcription elongation factor GreB
MSRGFVREGDQEEVPMVPQRAYLPAGVANFVTREGIDLLLKEREELLKERESLVASNENEKRIEQNFINAKLQLLNDRIADARIMDGTGKESGEITFGARVTLLAESTGREQTIKIVGVDEAVLGKGRISFISPLAKALMNKKAGDRVVLKRDNEDLAFKILAVVYS